MYSVPMQAAGVLRAARERHGLDQRDLAALAATSQAQISSIERGATSPSVSTLARLLAAMGERLTLDSEPVRGNASTASLRKSYEATTPAQRVAQAAKLSRTLTAISTRAPR